MTSEELNALKRQRPFRPFVVITVEDEVHEVMQPGLILAIGDDVLIGFSDSKDPYPIAKDYVYMGLEHIARVEAID